MVHPEEYFIEKLNEIGAVPLNRHHQIDSLIASIEAIDISVRLIIAGYPQQLHVRLTTIL